jgi:hypothetical protein
LRKPAPPPDRKHTHGAGRANGHSEANGHSRAVTARPRWDRLTPRTGIRVQLAAAASIWLVGSAILLVRGAGYLQDRHWHAWALAAGLALGIVKARVVLEGVAVKAIDRIQARGRACVLGFFSWRSWALVAVMMGAGLLLRQLVVDPDEIGAGILGAGYVGVGCALLLADRLFWRALWAPLPQPTAPPQPAARQKGRRESGP